jgi:hypothetical protein
MLQRALETQLINVNRGSNRQYLFFENYMLYNAPVDSMAKPVLQHDGGSADGSCCDREKHIADSHDSWDNNKRHRSR